MSINLHNRRKMAFDAVFFEDPWYDNSIIGATFDGRAIYLFEKMALELAEEANISVDEAVYSIEFNELRWLNGFENPMKPIVIYANDWEELI